MHSVLALRVLADFAGFPLLFDPSWEVAHRFSTRKLPETHVVVAGEVVESFIGASDWASGDVQNRVLRYLRGRN